MDSKQRKASTSKERRAALIWCAAAITVSLVMILALNPFRHTATPTPAGTTDTGASATASPSAGTGAPAASPSATTGDGMFTGDAETIADQVRALLNAPDASGIDSMSTLLYRHGHKDLAEASDVYDAIGSQRDDATVRRLARTWYAQALPAAAKARLADLSDSMTGARQAASQIDKLGLSDTDGCKAIPQATRTAGTLTKAKSDDYQALTDAQQALTDAESTCAANLDATQLAKVFGTPQGTTTPDATTPDTSGKDAQ